MRDDSVWKKEIHLSFRRKKKEPEALPTLPWQRPVDVEPEPEREPVLEQPAPEPVAEQPESWLPRYEAVPVTDVWPEPEPVAEVEPEPEPVAEVEPEPVAEVEPEPEPVAQTEPEPVAQETPVFPSLEPKQRWWNKELSLRGGSKEPEPVAEFRIPEPKRHWWDKEVDLSRGKKQPAEPKPARPRRAKRSLPKPSLSGPSLPKKPSLPKPSLPKRSLNRHHAERVVGLKIGGSQIAAACVSNNGAARLEQVARMPLAAGVVAGGELRDPEALAEALRAFFARNKLPRRGVRLGVASSRIGVRVFEIAGIDDEHQFVNAVRFRAQEALPIPLDEAVLDYRVLGEHTGEDGQVVRRVLLVVAHRDLVDRYVEACRLAGVTLSGIDLEAFALLRALAPPVDRDGSALVAVSIGHERTTLAVSDGRVCEFTRVLEWGGWVLNVALARVLDRTPADVELVKRNLSLAGGPTPEGLSPEQAVAAVDAVRRGVESLARELVSSLQYYQSQPDSLGIGEVVLTGGTARLGGLAQELERLLGVPVRIGDPLARLEVAQPLDESELGSLAIAVGLGIED